MINDREFLGLKFLIPGFFWVGKFGEYFLGWIDLSRDFFGYSKQSEESWPRSSPNTVQPNLALEIWYRMFWGLIFGPGIFLGFVGSPRDFWGVLIFAPNRSSPSFEIWSTIFHAPPPPPHSTPGSRYSSPHVRESGFQNWRKFCLQNPGSWALESGIQLEDLGSH